MREIVFRGRKLTDGKWVEGFLITWPDGYPNIYQPDTYKGYTVEAATVGQYTGLKDKNGKRIFEGDILKVHGGYYEDDYYITKVWAEGSTLCVFVQGEDYDYTAVNFADDVWANADCEPEIIGNIHDNPERLT